MLHCHEGCSDNANDVLLLSVLEPPVQMASNSGCIPVMDLAHTRPRKVVMGVRSSYSGEVWDRKGRGRVRAGGGGS